LRKAAIAQIGVNLEKAGSRPFCFVTGGAPALAADSAAITAASAKILLNPVGTFPTPMS